nr:ATP-binding protein [uncultured Sellimonas sp.]
MSLTNSQYDAIMRMYEKKQLKTHDILDRHYEEIYTRIPRMKEIDDRISHSGVEKAKALIEGNTAALDEFRKELHVLSQEKHQLLSDYGYPSDYLEPCYECPDCHDTGYIDGHKCHCFQKAEIDLLYTQSNLQDILHKENFSTFRLDYYSTDFIDNVSQKTSREMAQEALSACRSFTDTFSDQFQNLLIYGNTGVGKTFLTHCIAKELIDKIHSVIYVTSSQLFELLGNKEFGSRPEDAHTGSLIDSCELLIIDDLGTELTNSFTVSQLFICLNDRIIRKKSTIISTNLSLNDIKSMYSERTFSRISSQFRLLKLTGDDIRIKKKLMK